MEGALPRAEEAQLVSATLELDVAVDPIALASGSRLATDRWFCWEQPDRGFALAGIGTAAGVVSRGVDRFRDLAAGCSRITRERIAAEPDGLPAGAGPVWAAGLAFAADGGTEAICSSLPPALAVLPELSIVRNEGRSFLTASVMPGTAQDPDQILAGLSGRLGSLRTAPLTPADPRPGAATKIFGRHPPERYEQIVATAVARIRGSEVDKVVLARELTAEAPAAHDPAAL